MAYAPDGETASTRLGDAKSFGNVDDKILSDPLVLDFLAKIDLSSQPLEDLTKAERFLLAMENQARRLNPALFSNRQSGDESNSLEFPGKLAALESATNDASKSALDKSGALFADLEIRIPISEYNENPDLKSYLEVPEIETTQVDSELVVSLRANQS